MCVCVAEGSYTYGAFVIDVAVIEENGGLVRRPSSSAQDLRAWVLFVQRDSCVQPSYDPLGQRAFGCESTCEDNYSVRPRVTAACARGAKSIRRSSIITVADIKRLSLSLSSASVLPSKRESKEY